MHKAPTKQGLAISLVPTAKLGFAVTVFLQAFDRAFVKDLIACMGGRFKTLLAHYIETYVSVRILLGIPTA